MDIRYSEDVQNRGLPLWYEVEGVANLRVGRGTKAKHALRVGQATWDEVPKQARSGIRAWGEAQLAQRAIPAALSSATG